MTDRRATGTTTNALAGSKETHRSLGGGELFTFAFGAIVGVAWIVLVGEWIGLAGPIGATLAFVLGGLIVLVVGYSYAELGSLYPRIGGELVFAHKIFGLAAAHAVGWVLLLLYLSLVAFESVSISWVLAAMFPGVLGPALYRVGPSTVHLGGALIGAVASLAIAWINYRGARSAGRFQDVLTVTKVLVALLFIAFGFSAVDPRHYLPIFGTRHGRDALTGFLLLLSVTPLFFAGFGVVTQAMGEARPHEFARLGRVLLAVIFASMVFYGSVILVVSGLLEPGRIAGYELPAAQAFETAFRSRLMTDVVLVVGLLGLMTTWNAVFFAAVRVLEGMAREGLIGGTGLTRSHASRSAPGAVLIALSVSLGGTLLGRGILLPIVSVGGLAVTVLFLFVCTACQVRRTRMPEQVPPYRAPGGQLTIRAGILLSTVLVISSIGSLVASAAHGVSAELIVVAVWAAAGFVVWGLGRTRRASMHVAASDRR